MKYTLLLLLLISGVCRAQVVLNSDSLYYSAKSGKYIYCTSPDTATKYGYLPAVQSCYLTSQGKITQTVIKIGTGRPFVIPYTDTWFNTWVLPDTLRKLNNANK